MIEKVAIFVLFLGPLVFFHELGHFLFARMCGVRVLVFSLGFGPKILKFKRGDTEYALSLIPLGGYVKMYGDDPFTAHEIPESERKYAFTHQSKWNRFLIVFGGPLANFILAFFLFMGIYTSGEKVPEARFGFVSSRSPFYELGIRTGDRIVKVNEHPIVGATDLSIQVGEDTIKSLGIKKGINSTTSQEVQLNMPAKKFFDEFFRSPPRFRLPVVISDKGDTYAISQVATGPQWDITLDEIGQTPSTKIIYAFPVKIDKDEFKQPELIPNGKMLTFEGANWTSEDGFFRFLRMVKLFPLDLAVQSIVMNSPADKAGIKANDILQTLEGNALIGFEDLRYQLQDIKNESVKITYLNNAEVKEISLTPSVTDGPNGKVKTIGIYGGGAFKQLNYVESAPLGFVEGLRTSLSKTWETIEKTIQGYKKLITNEVSLKNIGGPIAIGKVASDSFNVSLSYFFKLMAIISVNLGIINLFPIPVLDGGHIMFILFEIVNRGPLSRRKMEVAQQFGVSILFLMIFAALFNDISRLF